MKGTNTCSEHVPDYFQMLDALEEFYENAGFKNVREKILSHKTEQELRDIYTLTFPERLPYRERFFKV